MCTLFVVKGVSEVSTSASRVWFPAFDKNFKLYFTISYYIYKHVK